MDGEDRRTHPAVGDPHPERASPPAQAALRDARYVGDGLRDGDLLALDGKFQGVRLKIGTPHVSEQPYLSMNREDLRRSGRMVVQHYYETSDLVHSRASLTSELIQKLKSTRYVVTSTSLRELGLRDAIVRELVRPVKESDGTYVWQGIRLRLLRRFGSNLLWEVIPAETSN